MHTVQMYYSDDHIYKILSLQLSYLEFGVHSRQNNNIKNSQGIRGRPEAVLWILQVFQDRRWYHCALDRVPAMDLTSNGWEPLDAWRRRGIHPLLRPNDRESPSRNISPCEFYQYWGKYLDRPELYNIIAIHRMTNMTGVSTQTKKSKNESTDRKIDTYRLGVKTRILLRNGLCKIIPPRSSSLQPR